MKGSPSLQLYLDNPKRFFQRATARGFPKKRQEPLRRQLFEHISEHSTHLQDAKNLVDMLRVMETVRHRPQLCVELRKCLRASERRI